jgi:spore maturation protein CgeB
MHSPHELLVIEGRPLYGDSYAKALCSFDICLGFLCKANRDLQTTRTVEIPACQRFMLAERSAEQSELFEEGNEAEFFESTEELLRKIRFYLAHPEERMRIAAAGRERCLRSGYSNQERLKWALTKVSERGA